VAFGKVLRQGGQWSLCREDGDANGLAMPVDDCGFEGAVGRLGASSWGVDGCLGRLVLEVPTACISPQNLCIDASFMKALKGWIACTLEGIHIGKAVDPANKTGICPPTARGRGRGRTPAKFCILLCRHDISAPPSLDSSSAVKFGSGGAGVSGATVVDL
jgi:hypothetical protein